MTETPDIKDDESEPIVWKYEAAEEPNPRAPAGATNAEFDAMAVEALREAFDPQAPLDQDITTSLMSAKPGTAVTIEFPPEE